MSTYEILYVLVCKNGLGHQNNITKQIVSNYNIKCFIFKNFQCFRKCKMKICNLDTCEQNQNEQIELRSWKHKAPITSRLLFKQISENIKCASQKFSQVDDFALTLFLLMFWMTSLSHNDLVIFFTKINFHFWLCKTLLIPYWTYLMKTSHQKDWFKSVLD
jgi:hypothetical protein